MIRKPLLPLLLLGSTAFGLPAFAATNGTAQEMGREPAATVASNILPADTHGVVAPSLPEPRFGDEAHPARYLHAALSDLDSHHTGAAEQALEMAETRLLDRSVTPARADIPDHAPVVRMISDARTALGQGRLDEARQHTHSALAALEEHRAPAG
ncbi:hypothetical protein MVG78_10330 [Roseomonas gilardii subsp. gilardii]|uniref:hypothetical protein n=1 Tax=Roseomonas gilardii TaxID=257708 RepID=UPI001FF9BDB3|nr:hypothetical protein [Roseomonas gilardii]UPG71017.1 hypothetical protein MVG78_10330 [Roseomonas gilardii subsp. gilardii]